MEGKSVKDILTTCLMWVASGPQAILNHTKLRAFSLTTTYSTIFDWGTSINLKDESMYTLGMAAVSNTAACLKMSFYSSDQLAGPEHKTVVTAVFWLPI